MSKIYLALQAWNGTLKGDTNLFDINRIRPCGPIDPQMRAVAAQVGQIRSGGWVAALRRSVRGVTIFPVWHWQARAGRLARPQPRQAARKKLADLAFGPLTGGCR